MSGMIFGNGVSGVARRSVAEYLEGYVKGRGVFRVVGERFCGDGPGTLLRRWFRGYTVGLFLPVLVYVVLALAFRFGPDREVCVLTVYGFRSSCRTVRRETFYSLATAVKHAIWLVFFYLFEGEAVLALGSVAMSVVVVVGTCCGLVLPVFGQEVLLAIMLLVLWSVVSGEWKVYRWFVFVAVVTGFGTFACLGGLLVPSGTAVVTGESEGGEGSGGAEMVPHTYLSVEVPVGSCDMSRHYFLDRAVGGGMSNDERVMALKGDRFLKLLAARLVAVVGQEVSAISHYERAQEDKVFVKWLEVIGVVSGNGKKTRASFVEVLWGELFDLLVDGTLSFERVWEAFIVFHKDVQAVTECAVVE